MNEEIALFDSYADKWDNMRDEKPDILRHLLNLADIQPDSHVLDVGSGTGVLLPYLHKAVGVKGHITAVDFSKNMLVKAKEKFGNFTNISFIVSDVLEDSLNLTIYDTVTCLNFFPHLNKRKIMFMKKMQKVLCNGGSLVIMHDTMRISQK